jgi:hypothetical protein
MRGLYQGFTGDHEPPQPVDAWFFAAVPLNFSDLCEAGLRAALLRWFGGESSG